MRGTQSCENCTQVRVEARLGHSPKFPPNVSIGALTQVLEQQGQASGAESEREHGSSRGTLLCLPSLLSSGHHSSRMEESGTTGLKTNSRKGFFPLQASLRAPRGRKVRKTPAIKMWQPQGLFGWDDCLCSVAPLPVTILPPSPFLPGFPEAPWPVTGSGLAVRVRKEKCVGCCCRQARRDGA